MNDKTPITPEQMKEWRQRNRFSMAQAARRVGADRSAWSKWERGIARPSAENEEKLRSVVENFEIQLVSTRTKETFYPLLDPELDDFLRLAGCAEELIGAPIGLVIGPRRSDRRMEHLVLWFERYFHPHLDAPPSLSFEEGMTFYEVRLSATNAGFCVGSFKYAVTDDEAEEWYQAAESLFIDLMAFQKMFERDNPKKGQALWREAFERFYAGYGAAIEQRCWRDSAWYELKVLGAMFFDATKIPTIRSVISAEDFAEPQHRFMFRAVLDLFDQGKPTDADTIQSKLKDLAPPDEMDRSRWSWPVRAEGLSEGSTLLDYVSDILKTAVDPNDLMTWVMEIKQRSLSRRLMDGCRKVSTGLEQGLGLDKSLDELEQTILHLRSLSKQRETGHDNG